MQQLQAAIICILLLALTQQASTRVLTSASRSSSAQATDKRVSNPQRYVVVFNQDTDVTSATQRLKAHLRRTAAAPTGRGAVAVAAAATSSNDADALTVISTLNGAPLSDVLQEEDQLQQQPAGDDDESPAAAAVVAAAAAATASDKPSKRGRGVQGIVVQASAELVKHIRRSKDVSAVFMDRAIKAQVERCVEAQFLGQGAISATAISKQLKWTTSCMNNNTQLVWVGERCGDMSKIQYTAIYAVNKRTRSISSVNGKECVMLPTQSRLSWSKQRFGGCGAAPTFAASLPTRICSATDGSSTAGSRCYTAPAAEAEQSFTDQFSLSIQVECDGRLSSQLTYTGVPCGPDNLFVQWTQAVDGYGCIITPGSGAQRYKFNSDVFGSCGVPPGKVTKAVPTMICPREDPPNIPDASPVPDPEQPPNDRSPSPQPQLPPFAASGPYLPRVAVAPGEVAPLGLLRTEAVTMQGVASTAGLPVSQQVVVAMVDSGIEATHPDINYAGGVSFLPDDSDPGVDLYGHGTHTSGIVGAMNNGQGLLGVSPGVPVYSLKVLDSKGRGALSFLIKAVQWVLTEGQALQIKVINLSLAALVEPANEDYADTFSTVCGLFKQVSDAGIVVTVASGNYGADIVSYMPAVCPTVVAVTAISGEGRGRDAAASFSNWLPESGPVEDKARVIAAPGTSINSTMSYARDASGYRELSGTSMAAPHVAGIAANCIMSGACAAGTTGMEKIAVVQAAAKDRLSKAGAAAYGFTGDATNTVNGKYFGYLVWSAF